MAKFQKKYKQKKNIKTPLNWKALQSFKQWQTTQNIVNTNLKETIQFFFKKGEKKQSNRLLQNFFFLQKLQSNYTRGWNLAKFKHLKEIFLYNTVYVNVLERKVKKSWNKTRLKVVPIKYTIQKRLRSKWLLTKIQNSKKNYQKPFIKQLFEETDLFDKNMELWTKNRTDIYKLAIKNHKKTFFK